MLLRGFFCAFPNNCVQYHFYCHLRFAVLGFEHKHLNEKRRAAN